MSDVTSPVKLVGRICARFQASSAQSDSLGTRQFKTVLIRVKAAARRLNHLDNRLLPFKTLVSRKQHPQGNSLGLLQVTSLLNNDARKFPHPPPLQGHWQCLPELTPCLIQNLLIFTHKVKDITHWVASMRMWISSYFLSTFSTSKAASWRLNHAAGMFHLGKRLN